MMRLSGNLPARAGRRSVAGRAGLALGRVKTGRKISVKNA